MNKYINIILLSFFGVLTIKYKVGYSLFIPIAFMGGMAGVMYRQFAITIVISVIISGIVALTFTPALCMLLLKHGSDHKVLPLRLFNKGFDFLTRGYVGCVKFVIKNNILAFLLYACVIAGVVLVLLKLLY